MQNLIIKIRSRPYIILGIIVILGFLLRVVNINSQPPALNWDEISHGYNAYSLFKTGSDEWGVKWPLANFRAYGDYPLPLTMYITLPFVAIGGLNSFTVRLPHIILGVGTIISVYYLVYGAFRKRELALISAFLTSITPWYVFESRFVVQSNVAVFFLVSSAALFVYRKKYKFALPLAALFLGLTLFSYHSTRIFSPLLLLSTIVIFKKELFQKSKRTLLACVLILLFFIPLPFILLNPTARARSTEVFLLNQNMVYSIEVARNNSHLSPLLTKIIYNKPVYFISNFTVNYLQYFSPQYLFFEGGTQYQFSIPHHGVLYLVELPFFYLGLVILMRRSFRKEKDSLFLLSWLLLSPIPASITNEHFAVVRSTTMLPLPEILVSLGFVMFLKYMKNKFAYVKLSAITTICLCIVGISTCSYLSTYFGSYRVNYSWAWQYGYKEVADYTQSHYDNYDYIIMTKKYGEPHEFILFYSQWSPENYKHDSKLVRYNKSNWWWVDSFGKYVFVNDWQIPKESDIFTTESNKSYDCNKVRCLLVTSPSNAPRSWKKISTVSFLDGTTAFEMYEKN